MATVERRSADYRAPSTDESSGTVFQPAVPVSRVRENIHTKKYVLPAIHREFVWGTDQIRALFDSLMRGYPIGAFLFWNVD